MKENQQNFFKIIFLILTSFIGLVFIFSGFTKLFPIDYLELTIIDSGISNWTVVPILARLLISLEFILGILLVCNLYLKKITLKLTFGLLGFFSIYLIYLIIVGNSENCNCFGIVIKMNPIEALIKNLIIIIILIPVYLYYSGSNPLRKTIIIAIISVTSLSVPYILSPIEIIVPPDENAVAEPLNAEILQRYPSINPYLKNKSIISFLSLTCEHCRIAAYKLHIIKKQHPEFPMFFILNGDSSDLKTFYSETQASDIPYNIILGKDFIRLAGRKLPVIMLFNKGIPEQKLKHPQLTEQYLENWFTK